MGQVGLGRLLGMGPKRNVVIGLVAGIRGLLSLSLHVWQKISPPQQLVGSSRNDSYCHYAVMGEPVQIVRRSSQLRHLKALSRFRWQEFPDLG